ncbi:MAG: response regulator transcription factor [Planctomycetota bacterium]
MNRSPRPLLHPASTAAGGRPAAPTGQHILVVDDEQDLVEVLVINLERAGYRVSVARDGRQALAAIAKEPPDLVVLDVMMPELSGAEVASRLRSDTSTASLPIVMLTAKSEEVDELVGLTVGADDYITKPFSVKVVLARIAAVLRRSEESTASTPTLRLGPVRINTETHECHLNGEPIKLTLTEFRLLSAMAQASGKVLSRATLMNRAMGPGVTVTERTIDVHITSIRRKLGDSGGIVQTVRGVGYRATPEPSADEAVGADSNTASA